MPNDLDRAEVAAEACRRWHRRRRRFRGGVSLGHRNRSPPPRPNEGIGENALGSRGFSITNRRAGERDEYVIQRRLGHADRPYRDRELGKEAWEELLP